MALAITDIKAAVVAHFGIPAIEMVSQRRARRVARPRQLAMALSRALTPLSFPQIGRQFGGRDHTTVMHACVVVDRLCDGDAAFVLDVEHVLALLTNA